MNLLKSVLNGISALPSTYSMNVNNEKEPTYRKSTIFRRRHDPRRFAKSKTNIDRCLPKSVMNKERLRYTLFTCYIQKVSSACGLLLGNQTGLEAPIHEKD